jgi:cytochrome c-type biogenesis protein CcmF
MPWLTATALLHALIMDDRRRGFRWWSMILTVLSFTLVLFGTFTTRSGLIQSVHAFARSPLGPYFLAAMGVTLVGSAVLMYSRRALLATSGASQDLLSREGVFNLTMILLLTITVSVLVGSLLPTLTEALSDARFEAGPAWFDRVTGPQLAALVLLMGVCPLIGRAVGAARKLGRLGLTPLVGGLAVPLIALLAGFQRPVSLIGFAVVGVAGGTVAAEFARGVSRGVRRGENALQAVWRVFGRNRRRYGGYLVHLGIILMAVGVIGTRFYPFETETVLEPGTSAEVAGYSLTLGDLQRQDQADHVTTCAPVAVHRKGRYAGALTPRLDNYTAYHQTVAVPAVMSGLRQDLYIVLAGWSAGGSQATLKVFINPLASFLWLGGLVLMSGGTIALWPEAWRAWLPARRTRKRSVLSTAGIAVGLALLAVAVWAMWGRGPMSSASGCTPVSSAAARTNTSAAAVQNEVKNDGASTRSGGGRPSVGEPAPPVNLQLLDGSTLSLSDLDGEVAVVNFWSPDCKPCKEELPDFQEVWETYREQGVTFVGVSMPTFEDGVREMVDKYDVTYPVALNTLAPIQYGITGVPETFVIDRDGTVAQVFVGPVSGEELREELDALLGG